VAYVPAPVFYRPAPRVVYAPAPVYYRPAPVYAAPVVVTPGISATAMCTMRRSYGLSGPSC